MADFVLFDELRISIRVPTNIDDAIRRILESRQFQTALRRAVHECLLLYPKLALVAAGGMLVGIVDASRKRIATMAAVVYSGGRRLVGKAITALASMMPSFALGIT